MNKLVWFQNQFGTWYATTRSPTLLEKVMGWFKSKQKEASSCEEESEWKDWPPSEEAV